MDKNLVIVGVLVLLVLVGAVQTFQLLSVKGDINDLGATTNVKTTSSSTTTSGSSGGEGSVPTNLQNLPGMVGGC